MNDEHIKQLEDRFLELAKDEPFSKRDNQKLQILSKHLQGLYKLREEKEKEILKINGSNHKFSIFIKELRKSDAINKVIEGIIKFTADPVAYYQSSTTNTDDKE